MSGWAGVIGVVSSIFSAMAKPCWESLAMQGNGSELIGNEMQGKGEAE